MSKELDKIQKFLDKHHVLSLATNADDELSACNLFYVFDKEEISFIVASAEDTNHITNISKNPKIAGTVVLETKIVGKIQGVQFRGEFLELSSERLEELYFKAYPYSKAMNPKLWQIKVSYFKMTDNTLGFGKKLIWQDFSA